MSLFQRINNEKNELIHFETLLLEIAAQEKITFSEACAVVFREASEHLSEIPFTIYEPFYLYNYDLVNGFSRSDDFSNQSLRFLKSMAKGEEFEEDSNPLNKGSYFRNDGGNGYYEEFYFKGTELAVSFLDASVNLPPCLEKFRATANMKLERKAAKLSKAKEAKASNEISVPNLQEEIRLLKTELAQLSKRVPAMLGFFREDDPLLIAIKLRNSEWALYNEDDRKTIPSQEALVEQIKQEYKALGMPDIQAKAIEKVACPIKRK